MNYRELLRKEKKYFNHIKKNINDQHYFETYKKVRAGKSGSINDNKKRVKKIIKQERIIRPPVSVINFKEKIDIYKSKYSDITIKYVNKIYNAKNKKVFLNFKKIDFMSAAATAMLLSAIYRAKSVNKQITCNYPASPKICALMKQVGIFDAVGKKPPKNCNINDFPDVKHWYKFVDDTLITPQTICEETHKIIDFCCDKKVDNIDKYRDGLELNIGETILNIFDHAYEKESTGKNWVLFVRYIVDKESLCLIVSDHGIGIPKTFQNYHEQNSKWDTFLNNVTPSRRANGYIKESIENLFELKKSKNYTMKSTKDRPGRGTGLKKIKDEIDKYNSGYLNVYSHDGFYSSVNNKKNFKTKIFGTIIEIVIPIKAFE
jgi:anti-sigma regulatory factor (Ser/Thr protein kinase)/anti-anti-sigma regulatory factor